MVKKQNPNLSAKTLIASAEKDIKALLTDSCRYMFGPNTDVTFAEVSYQRQKKVRIIMDAAGDEYIIEVIGRTWEDVCKTVSAIYAKTKALHDIESHRSLGQKFSDFFKGIA